MKILHCADLHLDSPLTAHLSDEKARRRNAEILSTFERMTHYAQENGVRLVLLAGDIFDSARISRRTVDSFLSAIQSTPDITYLSIFGNHDGLAHAFADRTLPDNLKAIGTEWETYCFDDVAVSGITMTPKNAESLYDCLPSPTQSFHIVMLHGNVGTRSGMDCVNLTRLQGKNIQYLALGHLHSYQQQPLGIRGLWCYSGCLEGRGFDECGEKGFVLLDTQKMPLRPQFVPFSSRQLFRLEVQLPPDLSSNSDTLRLLRNQAAEQGVRSRDMVEFVLTGRISTEEPPSAFYLSRHLQSDFFYCSCKDERRLSLRFEDYRNDISLKGEFIRLVLQSDESDADKQRILSAGLEALMGEEITL